jgi:mannosyl-oligosaccharide alpha-1,2-mannosidase
MLLIRRLWLLPAAILTLLVYYIFSRGRESTAPVAYPANGNDGLLHWTKRPEKYPVDHYNIPPRGAAHKVHAIQARFSPETPEAKEIREIRQTAVKEAFLHSWNGYKTRAWMMDELSPISGSWRSSFGGWGATLVDSMDTLWIMGLKEDFAQCVEAVRAIDFTTNTEETLNVFETTIRYMGGLLAAYDLSDGEYKVLLTKARELGEILYTAFDTPNRMPVTRWQWRKSAIGGNLEAGTSTLLAELGSLSLEFTRLTQLTGDVKYFDAVTRIANEMERLQNTTKIPGLWPTIINADTLTADYNHFTFGGMADSTYEYLPKQHLLLGARTPLYKNMYEKALEASKKYLFFRPMVPDGKDILFSGNTLMSDDGTAHHEAQGQHLGCFVAGMVGMGARVFWKPDDLDIAQRLVDGCIWAYETMPTGLMPETFHMLPCHVGADEANGDECKWDEVKYYTQIAEAYGHEALQSMTPVEKGKYWAKLNQIAPGMIIMGDNRYILRPEAIESVFIMYRITGDPKLLDSAWKMFQSIDKWTRTEFAHAALNDVRHIPPEKSDRMESFWLAETLKYFYLIFSEPSLISLDEYVLNTEAHPLKRPSGVPMYFSGPGQGKGKGKRG